MGGYLPIFFLVRRTYLCVVHTVDDDGVRTVEPKSAKLSEVTRVATQ